MRALSQVAAAAAARAVPILPIAAAFAAVSLAFLGGLGGGVALADGKPGGAYVADAIKRLKSGNSAQVGSALDDVRIAGKAGAAAVPAIVDLLAHGLSPELTQSAVDTLGDTESEAATPALAWYARHRNVAVRRGAVQALARTRGPVAVQALRAGLSDPDPAVRGYAATGLGTMRAKEALGDLFLALDHRVVEASPSIGELCMGDECDKLAAKLGAMPFEVITSGLDVALFRTPADVNDDIKIKIVARVRELGTGEANRFLRAVQSKWARRSSAKVKQAVDQAVIATSASPGADGT
jgi:hypothetical protein